MEIAQVGFLLFFPCLIIISLRFFKKLHFISPIIVCYITGIVLGNIYFIPVDHELSIKLSEVMVLIAIPLILFSADFVKWIHIAGKTLLSFFLMIISVLAAATLATLVFSDRSGEFWKLSGMISALYTGGTVNLMSVGLGLGVQSETIVLVTASTTILGGIYLIFLLTKAKWLVSKFLPSYEEKDITVPTETQTGEIHLATIFAAIGLTLAIIGISVAIVMLVTGKLAMNLIMLLLTSLAIAASFSKRIRNIKGTYELGQYMMLVFALAIGTNIKLGQLLSSGSSIFIYSIIIMMGSVVIHLMLSFLFRIDADTTIIISTAGLYGPAITGVVASSLKNREILISGLTCAIAGYGFGTYLGMGLALLLMPK